MELVIASGKGGVGKTTFSTSLAVLLKNHNFGIVDADAEAPNMHLIFDISKWDQEIDYAEKSLAEIDYSKCTHCKICLENCPYEAIHERNGKVEIKKYLCEGCNVCGILCPEKAIKIKSKEHSGWIRVAKTDYGPFITSELDVGQPNSGKLVTEEKKIAREWRKRGEIKHIIVDSAAGIGCQVISSMSGASHAILVGEPTKSSLSDLSRAYYLANHFRIKSYIVINKYDINPEFTGIKDFAYDNGIEIIGKIPYDKNVPLSMAYKKPLVIYSENSKAAKAIKDISSVVEQLL